MKVKHGFFKLLAVLMLLCSSIAIVGCGGGGGSSNPAASRPNNNLKAVVINLPALSVKTSLRASSGYSTNYSDVILFGSKFEYAGLTDSNFERYKGAIDTEFGHARMSYKIISENRLVETEFDANTIEKFSKTDGFVIGVTQNPKKGENLRFSFATLEGDISKLNIDNILAKLKELEKELNNKVNKTDYPGLMFMPLEDGTYAVTQAYTDEAYKIIDLVIPSKYKGKDVTSIGMHSDFFGPSDEREVFGGNNSLTSVEIPETIKCAEMDSFAYCCNLKSITINSETIDTYNYGGGFWLFEGSTNVTSITLGPKFSGFNCKKDNSQTGTPLCIADFFKKFPKLESITFKGTKEEWNNRHGDNWWKDGVKPTVVHCSNGDVEKPNQQ